MAGPSYKTDYDFLILGHPRCGTGFMTKVMGKLGYDIGHEKMGKHGTSNWTYAVDDDTCFDYTIRPASCYNFGKTIHCVRDPFTALPSIVFTEFCFNPNKEGWKYVYQSTMYRDKHLKLGSGKLINLAVKSFLGWNHMIFQKDPDIFVRIEEVKNDLVLDFPQILDIELPGASNKRTHRNITKGEWLEIDEDLLRFLEKFCEMHQYPSIIERISNM